MSLSSSRPRGPIGGLSLVLLALASCSGSEPATAPAGTPGAAGEPAELPASIEVAAPLKPVRDLELVEDLSEEVADRLLDFSDKLRRRDFAAAATWFAADFAGHSWDLPVTAEEPQPLDVVRKVFDVKSAQVVASADFLDSIVEHIGPWARMESVLWKVKAADFQMSGEEPWGKVRLALSFLGTGEDGGRRTLRGKAYVRVVQRRGEWSVQRFQLKELDATQRSALIFVDASTSTGVARTGIRFGQKGNQSFAWNGAAAGDANGDGAWDLFVPSDGRNYFYTAQVDPQTRTLTFAEEAQERGLAQPDAGTGAVFFDADGDGDQDLAVGHVSWRAASKLGGVPLQFYTNDGSGQFSASALSDPNEPWAAYSLTVLDFDLDGRLDVFACGYGRVEVEHNNDWIEATNGAPNALLRNVVSEGGARFEDVGAEVGVRGNQWSYASAAADYDGDGDIDLYVANDYGSNNLFSNEPGADGSRRYRDVASEVGVSDRGNGMGVAWGDLDNDAQLDLYVSNMSSTAGNRILDRLRDDIEEESYVALKKLARGNTIFRGASSGAFEEQPTAAGGVNASWAWSTLLSDFDLDGRLDVFCVNGYVTGDLPHDT